MHNVAIPVVESSIGCELESVAKHELRFTKLKLVEAVTRLTEGVHSLLCVRYELFVFLNAVVHSALSCIFKPCDIVIKEYIP